MAGYRRLVASDPEEQQLREAWHTTREALDPSEPGSVFRHGRATDALLGYLWRRASAAVEADRAKRPKAKRNLPVGAMGSDKTRALS